MGSRVSRRAASVARAARCAAPRAGKHERAWGAGYPGEQRAWPERPGAQRRERASMRTRLLQGSAAVADAAIAAGCRFFPGYPMTPFPELLENMDRKLPAAGGVCINASSEIEAVNMVIGAAATGARAATGSCGQGIALMQEGVAELA